MGNRYAVPMVVKAIKVLEAFSADGPRLALGDVVNLTKLPKASAYRILETLRSLGYISRSEHGLYRLTFRLMDIAGTVQQRNPLRNIAVPIMERLQLSTGETVNLGVLEGHEVVYVEVLESSHSLRMVPRIGSAAPLHATSLGKAIAAYLPPAMLDNLLVARSLKKLTTRTIVGNAGFREELARVRELGYAVDSQEEDSNCTCVGAPILDARHQVVGAISTSAPSSRMPSNRVARVGREVQKAARMISERLYFVAQNGQEN